MSLETSFESPVPVRTVLQLVGGWIGRLGRVWVEGQIAECAVRGNAVFLTLRDPIAAVSVRVICSRQVFDAAEPTPADGARVVIFARPDFNANRGSFALTALEIRAVGVGELLARLEKLRRQLASEGLFSAERKRVLPFLPTVIGLICGRDSAAQRDVMQNAGRRWPAVRFRVEQTAVQGPYAAGELIDALGRLEADAEVDVIVIARGGGSLEDLLPFSDETLIRAVAACRKPVVSAIGHEQDTPLLDYVADVRASTPTDAAKRVVPDVAEQLALIAQLRDRARRCVTGWLDRETRLAGGGQVPARTGRSGTGNRAPGRTGRRAAAAGQDVTGREPDPGPRRRGSHPGPAAGLVARLDAAPRLRDRAARGRRRGPRRGRGRAGRDADRPVRRRSAHRPGQR